MAERLIRIGKVSSINAEKGMISVTYPDLDNATTKEFPVFSFTDEYKMPQIGQEVLVLHLSNGQSAGIVMGRYWNKANVPPVSEGFRKELGSEHGEAFLQYNDGVLTIHADQIVLDGELIEPEEEE
jgi:phage baseplate assembly protein gpV